MQFRRWTTAAAAAITAGLVLYLAPVIAHHASAPFYDPENKRQEPTQPREGSKS